jgi:hypothetical protein
MPARDFIHDAVVAALIKDGWEITHDPLVAQIGDDVLFIDVGAEMQSEAVVAAERDNERIAVEIKTFGGRSKTTDFERAVGQFVLYNLVLRRRDPQRSLFLAVPFHVWDGLSIRALVRAAVAEVPLSLIVVDCVNEEIVEWINRDARRL